MKERPVPEETFSSDHDLYASQHDRARAALHSLVAAFPKPHWTSDIDGLLEFYLRYTGDLPICALENAIARFLRYQVDGVDRASLPLLVELRVATSHRRRPATVH